ncbi:rho GTPase-activating protein 32 isoform X3 [Amia ocellicauda]|uniref:rho GTPase-activating protein 32 isoform X3 n=1 Tax=Amia ocellicauda TaxID=2972642 RepID=UPI0034640FF9
MDPGSGAAAAGGASLGLLGSAGTHDIPDSSRGLRPCLHPEEDDIVPELARSIHPRERPDWEETISAMARSAEIPELSVEPPLRSCGSTASMKVKNIKKLSFTKGHFPKLAECAHFHYENVDFGTVQLALADEQNEVTRNGCESRELVYLVQICCQGRSWIVKRSYEDFRVLDKHLHLCIYDRRFSQLPELPRFDSLRDRAEAVCQMLMAYLSRLSAIADNKINCGPALTWMEIDNKGNHLLVHEESSINVPAIAAAHVIKRYIAQAADELSFEVGDIVSVIDMPPKEDTTWWRGKHGFQVGFFPSECVELINDKVPQSVTNCVPKPASPSSGLRPASWSFFPPYLEMESVKADNVWIPDPLNHYRLSSVSKKHGKLITFLRTFMKSRPTKQKLKQRGILRERVFGCDLGEHLLNSGHDVPQVLKSCTEFIEKHGVVDGIYRLSGIASNIQKLRHEFDSEQIPDLTKDVYIQDIHCVGSLCKLYFRELPNPLLTYQLYEKFSDAVSAATDEERLIKIHDVIQQLPPPHYRTLEFLMRHLSHLAAYSYITNMHSKNLAIVWAPNLLRSKQIESACFSGTAAFMEVRIQSVVVEFILNHVDVLFSPKLSSLIREGAGHSSLSRPKSLLVSSPSTKLLTLEEAQARTQAQINSPVTADSKYIEVGEGPAALQGKFHTVIEFPTERKRPPNKVKKSPVGSWRSFFNLGKSSSMAKRKLHRNPSEPNEIKAMALAGGRGDTSTLRSAKSEESLTSLHNVEGEPKMYRPRRPRSSSDALSTSFNGDLLDSRHHCNSYDNVPQEDSDGDEGPIRVPVLISPPRSAEDMDLSPPDIGMASLDFDPMSFQCSPPQPEPVLPSPEAGEAACHRRSAGSCSGSEPVTPSPEKFTSPFLSPDLSPALEKVTTKPCPSFAEKVAHALSPKIGRKSVRSPPLTISEPMAISVPGRVSDMVGSGGGGAGRPGSPPTPVSQGSGRSSPPPLISMLLKTSELQLSEGCHQEIHCKLVSCTSESWGQAATDRAEQAKPTASSHTQPGAVALDSPQGPVPVSSVSLLPPPPPPKNAARMLALALAESAQQATIQSQRRPSEPPTPVSPPRHQEPLDAMEWPPPPPLQPPADLTDRNAPPTPISSSTPATTPPEVQTYPPPLLTLHFTMANSGSKTPTTATTSAAATSVSHAGDSGVHTAPAMPSPRTTSTSPPPPLHRSPERQQPAMGQVPVTSPTNTPATTPSTATTHSTIKESAMTVSQQVTEMQTAGGISSQPLKKPADQPVPAMQHHFSGNQAVRPASAMAVPSHASEKPREPTKPMSMHPRAESVPLYHSYGPTPPTPPVRSIESKLATAALSGTEAANASNFHAILVEASMPASVEEALPQPPPPPRKSAALQQAYLYHAKTEGIPEPAGEAYYYHRAMAAGQSSVPYHYRPESVPPHLSYSVKPEPQVLYTARADNRYSTLGPKSFHQSIKSRGPHRGDYIPVAGPSGHRSQGYSSADGAAVYPTIRRVHSLHMPPTTIRSVPISRTEVPPDDELFYYQRPAYQYKPYQQPSQTDYHVTQLQPYFENGRVQYRYSPYSGANPLDAPYYDVDPYGTIRLRHIHPFTSRDLAPHLSRVGGKSAGYHYLSRHVMPPGKEHSFVSRDMPPSPDVKGGAVYLSWDPEETEKLRMHSIRRESRARQKTKGPVMSQYDNVAPLGPGELGGMEVLHLRSKSDPGKAALMALEVKDGRYIGPAVTQQQHPPPPRHPLSDTELLSYMEPEKHHQGNGLNEKVAVPQKQSGNRNAQPPQHHAQQQHQHQPPPPSRSLPQQQQQQQQQQQPQELNRPDPKNGPGEYEQSGSSARHWQEHPEGRSYQTRYERPEQDRHMVRIKTTGGYAEEDPQVAPLKSVAPPKPERSHSIRASHQHYHHPPNAPPHLQESLDRDHGVPYSYQPHGKRQSTMTVVSQYDNLDDYHPIPQPQTQPQTAMPSRAAGPLVGGGGNFAPPGFAPPNNNRTYATALGQGAFVQAELSLQRPEAEIHAE